MNSHTPQEWADITGCYVARDRDRQCFDLYEEKPEINNKEGWWEDTVGDVGSIPRDLVKEDLDTYDWTTLYEPRKADNAPHQSVREYVLVEESDPEELEKEVTRMLDNGWSLYGSPFTSPGGRFGFFYYQAMTRGKCYEQDV